MFKFASNPGLINQILLFVFIGLVLFVSYASTQKVENEPSKYRMEQVYIFEETKPTEYIFVLNGSVGLQPGEKKAITFTLTPADLSLWDRNMQFAVEPGIFEVMIGSSSEDIGLNGEFESVVR